MGHHIWCIRVNASDAESACNYVENYLHPEIEIDVKKLKNINPAVFEKWDRYDLDEFGTHEEFLKWFVTVRSEYLFNDLQYNNGSHDEWLKINKIWRDAGWEESHIGFQTSISVIGSIDEFGNSQNYRGIRGWNVEKLKINDVNRWLEEEYELEKVDCFGNIDELLEKVAEDLAWEYRSGITDMTEKGSKLPMFVVLADINEDGWCE